MKQTGFLVSLSYTLFCLRKQNMLTIPFSTTISSWGLLGAFSSSVVFREESSEACLKRSGSALLNCFIRWRTSSEALGWEGLGTPVVVRRDGRSWEPPLGALSGKEENIHSICSTGLTQISKMSFPVSSDLTWPVWTGPVCSFTMARRHVSMAGRSWVHQWLVVHLGVWGDENALKLGSSGGGCTTLNVLKTLNCTL